MKQTTVIVIALVLTTVSVPFTTHARTVQDWSYERLFKESDLIIIAQPTKSEDSADRTTNNVWKIAFRGVNTTFTRSYVLKGHVASELVVLHYKTDRLIANGPNLFSFRTKSLSYTIEREVHNGTKVWDGGPATYLLFLKKRDDGRFEPVSGQSDPNLSVRELRKPSPLVDTDE